MLLTPTAEVRIYRLAGWIVAFGVLVTFWLGAQETSSAPKSYARSSFGRLLDIEPSTCEIELSIEVPTLRVAL